MSLYLKRYTFKERLIEDIPNDDLKIVVTIPANKEVNLISSLQSLKNCFLPQGSIEVVVVINQPENAEPEVHILNKNCFKQAKQWSDQNSSHQLQFHILFCNDLPKKHAGVGLARKIAMDEAVRRFELVKNPKGIIACFDADSTCDTNYLVELYNHFHNHPKTPACSIYFEHPLNGKLDSRIYQAITDYELFLRYYIQGLRFAGFPMAFHTIGSSMAVRSDAYQKQGGMNRRKAGEDFYFLQRIFRLGNFTELNTTRIIPSPRVSDRVPFGTGKAVADWQSEQKLDAYDPKVFIDLKTFIKHVPRFFAKNVKEILKDLPKSINEFLLQNDFEHELNRIKRSSKSSEAFQKSFFHWFDGFKVLKYIHFARDRYFPNISIAAGATSLLKMKGLRHSKSSAKPLLEYYRTFDRSGLAGH